MHDSSVRFSRREFLAAGAAGAIALGSGFSLAAAIGASDVGSDRLKRAMRWIQLALVEKDPATFACLILAAIAYIPVSGAFPLNASIAEHWLYFPAAFLFLAAIIALSRLRVAIPIAAGVLGFFLVAFCARTFLYTLDWKNQRTFLERTIAAGGDSPRGPLDRGPFGSPAPRRTGRRRFGVCVCRSATGKQIAPTDAPQRARP